MLYFDEKICCRDSLRLTFSSWLWFGVFDWSLQIPGVGVVATIRLRDRKQAMFESPFGVGQEGIILREVSHLVGG